MRKQPLILKKGMAVSFVLLSSLVMCALVFLSIKYINMLVMNSITGESKEILLMESMSPAGEYKLEAYRTEPGATVDYSIKVYLLNNEKKTIIYNKYHERNVEISWLNNSSVLINGVQLDLEKEDTYDWRE